MTKNRYYQIQYLTLSAGDDLWSDCWGEKFPHTDDGFVRALDKLKERKKSHPVGISNIKYRLIERTEIVIAE